eukprot:TRINITY_DN7634_c0_g1_i1.p1 TRINITY_DN7634_c0_g1~~TRINITY_DN7634_c0_g1_i1.p1  ORF type:complete len:471 (+),score=157.78 TRINITY_DN7634_c0_g1_i1:63-1475(+)
MAIASIMLAAGCVGLAPSDFEIAGLPGMEGTTLGFKQYSGYMPINDGHGTELFFWFVESQRNPANDPVVLWMNGGPGSSSIAYGFWTEHGPFRLAEDGMGGYKPELYPYSWNRIANVIYLEAPAGVGFSFSPDRTKYENITDAQSSHDNFLFLEAWFNVFTQFKSNDFFITAESYGGHYGPTLAEQLIDNNNSINMKGLLIGNPGINSDWYYNVNEYAFVTFMWSHGLIPESAYFASVAACGWNDFFSNCSKDFTHPSEACQAATNAAVNYIPSPLDPYDVLVPTCHTQSTVEEGTKYVKEHTPEFHKMMMRLGASANITYNPCLNNWTPKYMNRPDVLKAIHADVHYTRQWPDHPVGWYYNEGPDGAKKDIALLYPKFFQLRPQWKQIVISGTADSAVPFMGTERWLKCLNRPVKKDFRAWMLDEDVAGMIIDWDLISFATVKGCGHTIPTYCPEKGFQFFENWLTDSW